MRARVPGTEVNVDGTVHGTSGAATEVPVMVVVVGCRGSRGRGRRLLLGRRWREGYRHSGGHRHRRRRYQTDYESHDRSLPAGSENIATRSSNAARLIAARVDGQVATGPLAPV